MIGIVIKVKEYREFNAKNTNISYKTRDVTIIDQNLDDCRCTFWGEEVI
jgi:hypothetical protein